MSVFKLKATGEGFRGSFDAEEVRRALALFADPEHWIEIRSLPSARFRVLQGDDLDGMLKAVAELADDRAVYWTLNPLAKIDHQARVGDVVKRRWLLVDVDRKKSEADKDQSATDAEKEACRKAAEAIAEELIKKGWPAPVVVDSGNGYHLLWRIDLPHNEESQALLRDFLKWLAGRFDSEAVEVDRKVHNASRISKLPGTWARKGVSTPDRPHRLARVLSSPQEPSVVTAEQIRSACQQETAPHTNGTNGHANGHGKNGSVFTLRAGGEGQAAYARSALEREAARVALASAGTRNETLFKSACSLFELVAAGALGQAEVESTLSLAATRAGLGEQEVQATLRSAAPRGLAQPRDLSGVGAARNGQTPAATATAAKPAVAPPVIRMPDPYQPFPVDALPCGLAQFVSEAATALHCDASYVALPALAAVASAIGNTRTLSLKRTWREPAIVWALVVGDSGTLKTPAYKLATNYLFAKQRELLRRYETEMREYRRAQRDDSDPGEEPKRARLITSDVTIESLVELLDQNPRGVLVARDELAGWLGSFSRYKGSAGGSDMPAWLELHQAGSFVVDRKTGEKRVLSVKHGAVSVTGSIQPGALSRCMKKEFLEAGLGARILLAWPLRRPKKWTTAEVSQETEGRYHHMLDWLLALQPTVLEDGETAPLPLDLDPEAMKLWVAFYEEWAEEQLNAEGELAAALSKLEGYAARLALVHHCATMADLEATKTYQVGTASVRAGITLAKWFAGEARRVYAIIGEADEERALRSLVEWIRAKGGEVTARQLRRSSPTKYRTTEDASAMLQGLVDAGVACWIQTATTEKGGRPTQVLRLSPVGADETDETDVTAKTDETAKTKPQDAGRVSAVSSDTSVLSVSSVSSALPEPDVVVDATEGPEYDPFRSETWEEGEA